MNYKNYNRYGFSLMEMSIVVAIIGLIVASVATGFNLVHSAKIRNTITSLENFKKSTYNFIDQYNYFPGDMPNASKFWGTYQSGQIIQGADDGNGNGFVESDNSLEDLYYWRHLSLSKNISGNYTGKPESTSPLKKYKSKVNAPGSEAFKKVLFSFETHNKSEIWGTTGNAFRLAAPLISSNNNLRKGAISVKDAYSIDTKIDDGKASYGDIYAIGDNSCVDGVAGTDSKAKYMLNHKGEDCTIIYWYTKFNI